MNFQQVFTEFEKPYLPVAASTNLNSQQAGSQMVQQQSLIQPQQPQCSICGTTQKLLRCAKCKTIYYCSIDHQHLDWPTHKQECRALAKQRQINNRLQQLTSGCGAININAHSNANIVSSLSHISSSNWTSNSNIPSTYDNNQLDGNAFILGTHENEILNSKAETVTQNSSNCEYVGNFDANSTTTDQMHLMVQNKLDSYLSIDVNQLINDNSHCCQVNQQEQLQEQTQTERSTNNVSPPTITFQPEIQIQEQAQPQTQSHQLNIQQQPYTPQQQQQQLNVTLQYPVPQLSNHIINQHEKSSSYQISTAIVDDNLLENVNERRYEELCRNIINDMNQYGLSVVDDFLGRDKGLQILNEVHQMYSAGVFKDGQLVNNVKSEQDLRTIRGDKITWVKGIEPGCSNIGYLINQIDAVICRANSMRNNGKLGNYIIKERTKAMVACYPGSGSHYVMHVDNPNKDGRVITAIYYLNLNWDSRNNGGVLRIFPEQTKSVADIEPKFDRLIFFWSDKRNPHEVQPAHNTRYAITVWYFDANEREQALNRCKNLQNSNNANINNSASASPASNGKTVKKSSNIVNSDTVASSNTNYSRTSSTVSTPSSSPSTSLPSLSVTTDNFKHPSTTTHTMEIPTKPIQVVRPNTYK